ncbi:MAG: AraC family transcriptional regulator [Spirochaetota bacterium]
MVRRRLSGKFQLDLSGMAGAGLLNFYATRARQIRPPTPPHTHAGFAELYYVSRGEQFFEVNGYPAPLHAGEMLITFPEDRHSSAGHPNETVTSYMLWIDITRPDGFLGLSGDDSRLLHRRFTGITNRHVIVPGIETLFHAIVDDAHSRDALARLSMQQHLREVVLRIITAERANRPRRSAVMRSVLRYIDAHAREDIGIGTLAALAHLSVPRFRHVFRETVGLAPNEYIVRQKIAQAKTLLYDGSSVTDAAFTMGFSSSQYFSTVFKRLTGQIPRTIKVRTKA